MVQSGYLRLLCLFLLSCCALLGGFLTGALLGGRHVFLLKTKKKIFF